MGIWLELKWKIIKLLNFIDALSIHFIYNNAYPFYEIKGTVAFKLKIACE